MRIVVIGILLAGWVIGSANAKARQPAPALRGERLYVARIVGKEKSEVDDRLTPARLARAVKIVGATYLLTASGKPFRDARYFRKWVRAAGLIRKDGSVTRSPHGIRKATGGFMAEAGASEYEIMAVHGHSSPKTSAIYTTGASRAKLAAAGLARLRK